MPYERELSLHISPRVARSDTESGAVSNGKLEFVWEFAKRFFIYCLLRNADAQLLRWQGFGGNHGGIAGAGIAGGGGGA